MTGARGYLNDMWLMTKISGTWHATRIGGQTTNGIGTYPAFPSNALCGGCWPGARHSASWWIDSSQQGAYLFGGDGLAAVLSGDLNDLWYFDFAASQWAWLGGSKFTDDGGFYPSGPGDIYPSDPMTFPRARKDAMVVEGASFNKIYLFGGQRLGFQPLNDMFEFDMVTRTFTWIGGSSTDDSFANKLDPPLYPGSRCCGSVWKALDGFFMAFGEGHSDPPVVLKGLLREVWFYSTTTKLWERRSRSSSNGLDREAKFTPQKLEEDYSAAPGARRDPAVFELDDGALFIGGYGLNNATDASQKGQLADAWAYDHVNNIWVWYR